MSDALPNRKLFYTCALHIMLKIPMFLYTNIRVVRRADVQVLQYFGIILGLCRTDAVMFIIFKLNKV